MPRKFTGLAWVKWHRRKFGWFDATKDGERPETWLCLGLVCVCFASMDGSEEVG